MKGQPLHIIYNHSRHCFILLDFALLSSKKESSLALWQAVDTFQFGAGGRQPSAGRLRRR